MRRHAKPRREVQQISFDNSWMHGPTDVDWFFCLRSRRRRRSRIIAIETDGQRPTPERSSVCHMNALKPDPMIARDLVGYARRTAEPGMAGRRRHRRQLQPQYRRRRRVHSRERRRLFGRHAQRYRRADICTAGFRWSNPVFEYGSRRGAWRVLDILRDHDVAVSVLGVARAFEQNQNARGSLCRSRPRNRQPRLSLDRLWRGSRGYRARTYFPARRRYADHASRRAARCGWMTGRPGPNTQTTDLRSRRLSL